MEFRTQKIQLGWAIAVLVLVSVDKWDMESVFLLKNNVSGDHHSLDTCNIFKAHCCQP